MVAESKPDSHGLIPGQPMRVLATPVNVILSPDSDHWPARPLHPSDPVKEPSDSRVRVGWGSAAMLHVPTAETADDGDELDDAAVQPAARNATRPIIPNAVPALTMPPPIRC